MRGLSIIHKFFSVCIALLVPHFVPAQTSLNRPALNYEEKELWFDQQVSLNASGLINGPEYNIAFQGGATHPFFGTLKLTHERLWFDDQFYPDVQLLYDLFTDILVYRYHDKNGVLALVQIDQEKVQKFTMYGHLFCKMSNPTIRGGRTENGYHDVLFDGRSVKLVAKRIKSSFQNKEKARVEYQEDDRYYLIYRDQWAQISDRKSIVDLMGVNSDAVKNFIKSKKIKLRRKEDGDLKALAEFCDTLANNSARQ